MLLWNTMFVDAGCLLLQSAELVGTKHSVAAVLIEGHKLRWRRLQRNQANGALEVRVNLYFAPTE